MRLFTCGLTFAVTAMLAVVSVRAEITREEALAAVYPGASVRMEQLFLTPSQQKQVLMRGGIDAPTALVARYVATRDRKVIGRAYVDTHVVRTKRESLLISLDAVGRVLRIDVTAFLEPPDYRASEAWLRQFRDRKLDDDLAVNRAIRPIAGASLTARETTKAVRRVLAIDAVLEAADAR